MIVDAHCHLWSDEIPSPMWKRTLVEYGAALTGQDEEAVRPTIEEGYMDISGDMLVEDMDEAGIDRTIINILDWGLIDDEGTAATLEEQHEARAEAVARHPDRLACMAGVDPRRPGAAEFVERALEEWDMIGVKVHPCSGFYPDEGCCYPVYEVCRDYDVPVMIHTGPEIAPFRSKFGRPARVDEVANRYPDLDIVMAHVGLCWWEEGAEVAGVNPNVWVDLGYWQTRRLRRPHRRFYEQLRYVMDVVGSDQVLFGSDWPALRLVMGQDEWVETFQELPDLDYEFEFTRDEVDGVLGENAADLFELE